MDGEKRWMTLSMIHLQLLPSARCVTQAPVKFFLGPSDQQGGRFAKENFIAQV